MRLMVFFLFIACLKTQAGAWGQRVTLSVEDAPLEKVFSEIKAQTGYTFAYSDSVMVHARRVTVHLSNAEIGDALKECFAEQPLMYEIIEQTIVVREKAQEAQKPAAVMGPPPGEVHGRVVDSTGTPLAGASVTVKGIKKGTETDAKGEFVLKGVEENATLVVSFTGYEQEEVRAVTAGNFRVVLKHSDNPLDQVQIIAYGTSSKRFLTGDVSTVKSAEIEEQPVTDPLLALEGRVPGLYIQQASGVPGAYSTVRIMGQNSIANGNNPLYIIDGVPYSSTPFSSVDMTAGAVGANAAAGQAMSPFNALNPTDIESIDILKDADATSIYGSRGANGVILITTKRGKAGKTKMDVNVYSGSSQVARRMDLLNTQQYLEMRRQAFTNDGLLIPSVTTSPTNNQYDINGVWDTTRYTDWQRVLIGNPSHFSSAQLTFSGGNANTQFLVGGGYSNQGTVFPGNFTDKKGSAHVNITHISSDRRLHLQAAATYVLDNSNLPSTDMTSGITLAADAPALFDTKGNLNWQIYNNSNTWTNPVVSEFVPSTALTKNLVSNVNLDYELFTGLHIKGSAGYTDAQMTQHLIRPATEVNIPPNNTSQMSYNEFAISDFQTWVIEPQLTYQLIMRKGQLDVLAGSTFQQNQETSESFFSQGFSSDALINNPLSGTTQKINGNEFTLYHYAALFARLGYNWDRKYVLDINTRRDGSSRFGPGKQFGNFGSVGAAWIFSSEQLVTHSMPFLSFGKLRASYGTTGNDQITDYQYLSSYSALSGSGAGYQNITGLYATRIANPYFSWEMVKKLQIGLDLGFLKDRLLFSGTWYRNRDNNQLVGYPLSSVTGFTTITSNFPAQVQNTGEEFTLTAVVIKKKKFGWTTALNFTLPRNKLVSYQNFQNSPYVSTYTVGKSLFSKPIIPFAGVNSQTGVYEYYSQTYKSDTSRPLNPQDKIASRPITQQYYGGFQNSLAYKGFQFEILIQFVKQFGYNYINYFQSPGIFNTKGDNEPTAVLSRWQNPGDHTNVGKYSTKNLADPYGFNPLSTHILGDASFIRLKNMSLSWQLPADLEKKARLQGARIYIQCQNLVTWTKYLGLDPETGGLNLPPLRTIVAGIQVSL